MGWETRERGTRYYTRSRRVGGKVAREYVGGGRAGELAAQMDTLKRLQRERQRQVRQAEKQRTEERDALLKALDEVCSHLVEEALGQAGYHQHKRQWRKRHGQEGGQQRERSGRPVLDALAPREEVATAARGTAGAVTREQRVRYILKQQGRPSRSTVEVIETSCALIDKLCDRLSGIAHHGNLAAIESQVRRLLVTAEQAIEELLEAPE